MKIGQNVVFIETTKTVSSHSINVKYNIIEGKLVSQDDEMKDGMASVRVPTLFGHDIKFVPVSSLFNNMNEASEKLLKMGLLGK